MAPELCVLLTPRAAGGHEAALFGWLADAVRHAGLRPRLVLPDAGWRGLAAEAGLGRFVAREEAGGPAAAWRALAGWPVGRPLLLAPGVLQAQAWLLAAALARGHRVWVYVPMAHTARQMGFRGAALRDTLLAPLLRRVAGWITLDHRQATLLRLNWRVDTPVLRLPNQARLRGAPGRPPPPVPDGRLRVAWVGRFDLHQKGLDWLAAQIAGHEAWQTHFRWRFQGRGAGEGVLRALAGTCSGVEVFGHAPIAEALRACDLLLLNSRFEGVPLVALEAVASGWPVVATRQSGLQELLDADALFDFGDAPALRQALERLRAPAARAAAVARAQARLQVMCEPARYQAALHEVAAALRARAGAGVAGAPRLAPP